ncbi:SVOPL-like protein, partial [Mya arenaria]
TLYMVAIWIGYFGLLTSFSPSYTWVLILRGLVGGGMAGSPQSFTLLTEYLPSKYRAKLLNISSISWASGTMFEIVIASIYLPESARYLVAAGRKEEAHEVLAKAARLNRNSLPEGNIVNAPVIRNAQQSGEKCKCNLLKKDDYTTLPLNVLLIDVIGRRWTGAVNLFGCGLFFILLQCPVPQAVLTTFIFLVRGFSSGMFNFVYIYTSEVYPTSIRTLGIGTASSWARVGAMITPFLAQVLLDYSLTAAVWVYGSIGLLCAVCAVTLPIETKGRELPQSITREIEPNDD